MMKPSLVRTKPEPTPRCCGASSSLRGALANACRGRQRFALAADGIDDRRKLPDVPDEPAPGADRGDVDRIAAVHLGRDVEDDAVLAELHTRNEASLAALIDAHERSVGDLEARAADRELAAAADHEAEFTPVGRLDFHTTILSGLATRLTLTEADATFSQSNTVATFSKSKSWVAANMVEGEYDVLVFVNDAFYLHLSFLAFVPVGEEVSP